MTTNELRSKYLEFFRVRGHKLVSSDSLVPADDPTVLFTCAGMNQFKKQFLADAGDFKRAVSCQKCLRTDDLDKVGKTSGHHTFFEMLGNFSFGDYFKQEAIVWAWEFMTEALGIPDKRLYVSVYKDDEEAFDIWRDSIKIAGKKILKLGDKDNFWPANAITQGPNGPCGPCSEIFYDWGEDVGCGKVDCSPACGCERFVEVWNLVFTQFNRVSKDKLEPLPRKNIDTGMGLERISSVMHQVKSNFGIDIFKPIVESIREILRSAQRDIQTTNLIADHIRAIIFAISDGVSPSNEQRGYVVRKLIRRAYLAASLPVQKAENPEKQRPFIYKIVPVVAEVMKEPYPELVMRRENISLIIKAEEERFKQTLEDGERIIRDRNGLSDEEAFMLYDTHGYPLELLKEKGIKFDEDAVNKIMQKQRTQSKKSSNLSEEVFGVISAENINSTEDGLRLVCLRGDLQKTEFLGYQTDKSEAEVLAVIEESVERPPWRNNSRIILDKTPFYPQSGGQVADKGRIEGSLATAEVYDTRKTYQAIIHYVRTTKGDFKVGDKITAIVDRQRRLDIAANHTATHLLQAALRKALGEHVRQQGSLVCDDYLRFDFTHFKALTRQELLRIEELVNGYVRNNDRVEKREMSIVEARKAGALAFFAEKYEDRVRVVIVGDYSKEFCGGIHLDNTGQIGLFRITSEGAVASGIRRIEAISGRIAYKKIQEDATILVESSKKLKVHRDKLTQEIDSKLEYIKKLEKELAHHHLELFKNNIPQFLQNSKTIRDIRLVVADAQLRDIQYMRQAMDVLKNKMSGSYIIFLFSKFFGDCLFIVSLSADLKDKGYDAKKIIEKMGLKGGGRVDLVQGGMKNKDWQTEEQPWEKLLGNLKKIQEVIGEML